MWLVTFSMHITEYYLVYKDLEYLFLNRHVIDAHKN
jgi:hypothetical protein